MNNKLSGTIFILFGLGIFGDSAHSLYYGSVAGDFRTVKTLLYLLLGIASCIYGYKQLTGQIESKEKEAS